MKQLLRMAALACSLAGASSASAQVVINEIFYDAPGTDTACWYELKGTPGLALDGWRIVGLNGNGGALYNSILLDGQVIPVDGYFVIAQSNAVPNFDFIPTPASLADMQNGPDSILLQFQGNTVDAVGYENHTPSDIFGGEGQSTPDQLPPNTLARCPDGSDTNNNFTDFKVDPTPTPGTANDASCPQGQGACCLPNFTCVVTSLGDCTAQGGDYFGDGTACSPSPCPARPLTICEARQNDADGLPVYVGQLIETTGIATVASGTYSPTVQEFTLTDGDCCISVFGGALVPSVQIGDEVRVTGTVANFNGRNEITSPGLVVTVLSSGNPVAAPTVISTFELSVNGENYESCLIKLECVLVVGGDPWPADNVNANVIVDDGSGPVTLRIDRDTNIDGTPGPTGPFSVVGMATQFDASSPYSDGYQVIPRGLSDLDFEACAPPPGACCFAGGVCEVVTELECGQNDGNYQGDETTCDPNPCPQPVGACCLVPRGVPCVVVTAEECALQEGNFLGNGTTCDPNPCPLPIGACCYQDGSCVPYTEQDCDANGGVFQGDFTACDPNPCPPPPGACCFDDGTCVITSLEDCVGEFLGSGTICDPNPCPPPVPTDESSWGSIKNRYK